MKFEEFDSLDLDLGIGKEDKMPDVVKPAPAAPAEQYPQQPYGVPAEPYPQQPYGVPAEPYPQQPYGAPAEPYPQQPYGAPAEPYPPQQYPIYGGYPVPPKPKKRVPVILLSVIAAVVLISVVLILTGVFSGGKGNVPEEPPMANEESAAADHVGKPLDPAVVTTAPVVEEEAPGEGFSSDKYH